MHLAACYIVKNEAGELDRSIHSLRHAVEELVVVDTGSKDSTVEIARSYGAKIFSFPWQDHFAKARNFALEHVESPWILFLDADEYFKHPKLVRPAMQSALEQNPGIDAMMLVRYNVDIDAPENTQPYDISLRALRNATELRYEGRIHEMLHKQDGSLELGYPGESLALIHTGYSTMRSAEKGRRNLALLQKEIEEKGCTPFHHYNLSVCYFGMRDYEKSLFHAMQALDSDMQLVGGQGDLYHIAIESMRQLDMPLPDMLDLTRSAIRELPDLPEFYAEQGMVLCAMGQLDDAAKLLEKAMQIYDASHVNYRQGTYFTADVAAIVCNRLGEIAQIQGNAEAARHWFLRAGRPDTPISRPDLSKSMP